MVIVKKVIKFILVSVGVFVGGFVLIYLIFHIPVRMDPSTMQSCGCEITEEELIVWPIGFSNPRHRKQWKVTAKYDAQEKTVYVTCWLKAGHMFNGFSNMPIDISDYGEIDKVVIVGGTFGNKEKTVWRKSA